MRRGQVAPSVSRAARGSVAPRPVPKQGVAPYGIGRLSVVDQELSLIGLPRVGTPTLTLPRQELVPAFTSNNGFSITSEIHVLEHLGKAARWAPLVGVGVEQGTMRLGRCHVTSTPAGTGSSDDRSRRRGSPGDPPAPTAARREPWRLGRSYGLVLGGVCSGLPGPEVAPRGLYLSCTPSPSA